MLKIINASDAVPTNRDFTTFVFKWIGSIEGSIEGRMGAACRGRHPSNASELAVTSSSPKVNLGELFGKTRTLVSLLTSVH